MNHNLVKDDSELVAAVEQAQQKACLSGTPEPKDTGLGDISELRTEFKRLRRNRHELVRGYHIIIEPINGHYQAYAPAIPKVIGQGQTPQKAKKHLTSSLRLHLLVRYAQGELPPEEEHLVDMVVVSFA